MKKTAPEIKPERVQIHMLQDNVATKRVIEVAPGTNQVTYQGVTYQRSSERAGLHGHPGASVQPTIAVFRPVEEPASLPNEESDGGIRA